MPMLQLGAIAAHHQQTRGVARLYRRLRDQCWRQVIIKIADLQGVVVVHKPGPLSSPGGSSLRCSYAARIATRPRGVRAMKPSCSRYGSYTSSIVSESSLVLAARVSRPTGPPLNFWMIVR